MRYGVNLVSHVNVGSMTSSFFQGVTSHLGNWFGCLPMMFPSSMCNKNNPGEENQREVFYWRQLLLCYKNSGKLVMIVVFSGDN